MSFTTSPLRINLIKPMIDSILNQTRKPDFFVLNIPKVFSRTGKSYNIPNFIKNNNNITVNVVERDYGPATKVIPTIQFVKEKNLDLANTRIIYVDDDIKQLPDMIKTFLMYSNNEKVILGTSGFDFKFITNRSNMLRLIPQRQHLRSVSIIEGYGAVCLSPNVFKEDFMDYFNNLSRFKYCLLSDDVILSNYYNISNKCGIVYTHSLNIDRLADEKGVLDYGNLDDALHIENGQGTGNTRKYVSVIKHLTNKGMLNFNIGEITLKMQLSFGGAWR